jgi:hypothetical protein
LDYRKPEVIAVDQHLVSNHSVWRCGGERSRRDAQLLGVTRDDIHGNDNERYRP